MTHRTQKAHTMIDSPAVCPACNADQLPGTPWCTHCRPYVARPEIGRLSPPIRRLGAHLLDSILPVGVMILILSGATAFGGGRLSWYVALLMLAAYVFVALLLFVQGTTPGKRLLHMRVIKETGDNATFLTMLGREWIGKWISGALLLLGYLWILFDRENQGLHDKLLRTYVVEHR